MTSATITHLHPPGSSISAYDATLSPAAQPPPAIPPAFLDAMIVRTAVFVGEQGVPGPREHDADDARSHHWVAYAAGDSPASAAVAEVDSAAGTTSQAAAQRGPPPRDGGAHEGGAHQSLDREHAGGGAAGVTARRPVGTIRAVLPDPPGAATRAGAEGHVPGDHGTGGGGSGAATPPPSAEWPPHPTAHAGEAYVRLGRLATLAGHRGQGVARQLVEAVLEFLARPGVGAEMRPGEEADRWKGLVVVHAQRDRSVGFWRKFGFVVDEGMGEWDEEGMMHVGMYRKLDIARREERREEPVSVHMWLLDRWDENVL
jgi:predicted GNAT family N-acyltransferase